MNLFSFEEGSLLLRLMIAHLLADFYFQKTSWVQDKMQRNLASPYLWLHASIAAALAWFVLWNVNDGWVFVITFITHGLIDAWKINASKKVFLKYTTNTQTQASKELQLFIIDQAFHFIVIFFVWLILIRGFEKWIKIISQLIPDYQFLLRLLGYILVVQPTGFLIGFITKRWLPELNMKDSLRDAGTWIGMLERVIVLTFIFINQYSAIGFLIAAKSILRVTDKPEKTNDAETTPFSSSKHTEYVLIGTFLSFGIALLTGVGINYLLSLK